MATAYRAANLTVDVEKAAGGVFAVEDADFAEELFFRLLDRLGV
ncbi:hypothetical protein [Streptomyces sp. NPDC102476]